MEIQIDDLVQSIKRDGIEQARKEADAILVTAKAQASDIIAASKKDETQYKKDREKYLLYE